MAYIVGLVTPQERVELEERGWEFEDAPKELVSPREDGEDMETVMVFVDSDLYEVMTGPDWDKGPAPRWNVVGFTHRYDEEYSFSSHFQTIDMAMKHGTKKLAFSHERVVLIDNKTEKAYEADGIVEFEEACLKAAADAKKDGSHA